MILYIWCSHVLPASVIARSYVAISVRKNQWENFLYAAYSSDFPIQVQLFPLINGISFGAENIHTYIARRM